MHEVESVHNIAGFTCMSNHILGGYCGSRSGTSDPAF